MSLSSELVARFRVELLGQIVATLSGAILIVGLARLLQPDGYGLLFLSISIISIAQVFSKLGIAQSAARYISEYRKLDTSQIPHIIERSILFNSASIILITGLFLVIHEPIAIWLDEPEIIPLLRVGVLIIIFGSLTTYTRHLSQSFEDIRLAAGINVVDRTVRLMVSLGLVLVGYGVIGAIGGFVIGTMISSLGGLSFLYRRYYKGLPRARTIEVGLTKRIIEYNLPLTVTNFSGKLDTQIDTILVGFFLNPISVSFYVISKQVVLFLQLPAKALGFSISPTYGSLSAANRLNTAANMFEESLNHTLLLYFPAMIGILLVAEQGIVTLFGPSYSGAAPVLKVLSFYILLAAITKIIDHPLDYLGQAKWRAYAKGVASLSNVVLNLLLIPFIGVIGAAIATVVTHSFYVSAKIYLISTELPLDRAKIFTDIKATTLVGVGMGLVIWPISQFITGPLTLSITIFSGVLSWFVLSMIFSTIRFKRVFRDFKNF